MHINQLRLYNLHLVFQDPQLVKSFELTCFFRRCRKIHQAGDRFPSDVRWPDWYPSWRIISWCESCQTTFSQKEKGTKWSYLNFSQTFTKNYPNSPVWYRESAWNLIPKHFVSNDSRCGKICYKSHQRWSDRHGCGDPNHLAAYWRPDIENYWLQEWRRLGMKKSEPPQISVLSKREMMKLRGTWHILEMGLCMKDGGYRDIRSPVFPSMHVYTSKFSFYIWMHANRITVFPLYFFLPLHLVGDKGL